MYPGCQWPPAKVQSSTRSRLRDKFLWRPNILSVESHGPGGHSRRLATRLESTSRERYVLGLAALILHCVADRTARQWLAFPHRCLVAPQWPVLCWWQQALSMPTSPPAKVPELNGSPTVARALLVAASTVNAHKPTCQSPGADRSPANILCPGLQSLKVKRLLVPTHTDGSDCLSRGVACPSHSVAAL